jgi:hypothetical protein
MVIRRYDRAVRKPCETLLLIVLACAGPGLAAAATCALDESAGTWSGACGALIEDSATSVRLAPAPAITTGPWRRDERPDAVWSGTIKTADYPPTAVEVEIYPDRSGVMRTLFGWFPVTAAQRGAHALRFDVDATREAAPSGIDRAIVERARTILSTTAVWNRADNRKCPPEAKTWSIYCAMEKATVDVAGAFHHRRPALQVVRAIVDERTAARPYQHRLMDYNNDSTTTLADVRSLFAEALRRIDAQRVDPQATSQPGRH